MYKLMLKSENKHLNSNVSKSKHHLELPNAGAQLDITTLGNLQELKILSDLGDFSLRMWEKISEFSLQKILKPLRLL